MNNTLTIIFFLLTNILQAQDCWTVINLDGNEKKIFMGEPPKSAQPYKINLAAALTDEQYETYPDGAKSILKFTVLADGSTSDFKLLEDSPQNFSISEKQYN